MFSSLPLSSPQTLASRISDPRRVSLSIPSRSRISAAYTSAAAWSPPIRSTVASASLYDVLGIAAAASGSEIKAAYRRLARECHPDVSQRASGDEFMKVHAAYATLSDPEKRADYDRKMAGIWRRHPAPPPGSDFSAAFYGQASRRWETDQCW